MNIQRVSVSLFTLIAIVTITLAGATIWLFLTNPVKLARVLLDALAGLLKYL